MKTLREEEQQPNIVLNTEMNPNPNRWGGQMIVTDPKILCKKSIPVPPDQIESLRAKILEALPTAWVAGFGLAAIQVGVPVRYAYYRIPGKDPVDLINPKILSMTGSALHKNEGCLSFPNMRVDTIRFNEITVETGLPGKRQQFVATGLEAIIIQHEIDHMDGITMFFRMQDPFPGTSRNAPCPCGSGVKYKKCCLR